MEVENADADECADECGDDLSEEGMSRRNLDVVSEFEIVGEHYCVGASDVAERLEVVHSQRITFNERSSDEFSKDSESDFNTSHSLDDSNRNDKH